MSFFFFNIECIVMQSSSDKLVLIKCMILMRCMCYTGYAYILRSVVFDCQCASYAVGNAAYHGSELYVHLRPSIPLLLQLLQDPIAKIRANAAGVYVVNGEISVF